jgi:hypothetical protein
MTDFAECATWLLRSCGPQERAIVVSFERLQQQAVGEGAEGSVRGCWSQIKFESYTATHLSEIWNAGYDDGCRLVPCDSWRAIQGLAYQYSLRRIPRMSPHEGNIG